RHAGAATRRRRVAFAAPGRETADVGGPVRLCRRYGRARRRSAADHAAPPAATPTASAPLPGGATAMRFLAILPDPLREALGATVIYVTIGLSLLIISVVATATFKPKEGALQLMQLAAVPLSVDLSNIDLMAMGAGRGRRGGPRDDEPGGGVIQMLSR